MKDTELDSDVPEDSSRLTVIDGGTAVAGIGSVVASLKRDSVVLVTNLKPESADSLMREIADKLALGNSLELQSGFADFLGHRKNTSKYFMTVNGRTDYQFVTPHSEGNSLSGMQLAAFFCHENSTDGGESIVMNVNDTSALWESRRERVKRGRLTNGPLPRHGVLRARGLHQLNLPTDMLRSDDEILAEYPSEIPGLIVVDALAKPDQFFCQILGRKVNVYWDTVDTTDFDSAKEYARLLRKWALFKEPPGGVDLHQLDANGPRRVWHSGIEYSQLFKCRITRKLRAGDFIIQNNLTWTHSVSNWSPGSGIRNISASFA